MTKVPSAIRLYFYRRKLFKNSFNSSPALSMGRNKHACIISPVSSNDNNFFFQYRVILKRNNNNRIVMTRKFKFD